MRMILFATAAVLAGALLAGTAEAQSTKKARAAQPKPAAASSSFDRVRADSLDPAGDYRGYPDWARAAFGPRRGGGGR
jgi:hypothetical protein